MILRALPALALAALAAFPAAGNAAPPQSVTANYDVFRSGFHIAAVQETF